MKHLYIVVLFFSFVCFGQTPYELFNSKSEQFFSSAPFGYLKGLRADSVKFSVGDSIYYHYRVYYNYPTGPGCRIQNYPSWLGTRTIRKPNEDYIFFNKANDTIRIKAGAATGTSWTYYRYPSGDYIRATLASRQYTTTYNGFSDTVKNISFQAYNASNTPISHAYNTKTIKVARLQGIIALGNMYDFPSDVTIYDRSYGKHLTVRDTRDLAPGDIVQTYEAYSNYNMWSPVTYTTYYTDTITSRVYVPGDSVYITTLKGNTYKIGNLSAYVVKQMPEQALVTNMSGNNYQIRQVNYSIKGTGACQGTVISYVNDICGYIGSAGDTCFSGASVSCTSYGDWKYYEKGWIKASPLLDEYFMYQNYPRTGRGISFSKIAGVPCGTYYVTTVNDPVTNSGVKIYPNPAFEYLTIIYESNDYEYSIYSITGQLVMKGKGKHSEKLNIHELPVGLYFIHLWDQQQKLVLKFVKE